MSGEFVTLSEAGLRLIILEGMLENAVRRVRHRKQDVTNAQQRLEDAKKEHDSIIDQINAIKQQIGKM